MHLNLTFWVFLFFFRKTQIHVIQIHAVTLFSYLIHVSGKYGLKTLCAWIKYLIPICTAHTLGVLIVL